MPRKFISVATYLHVYTSVKIIFVYSSCIITNTPSFIYTLEILFQKAKHKDGKLTLLPVHKLKKSFSSSWKALGLHTCASHSFLTSAYISLSKTDLLFFIGKDILLLLSLSISLPSFVLPHGTYPNLT